LYGAAKRWVGKEIVFLSHNDRTDISPGAVGKFVAVDQKQRRVARPVLYPQ
jgi:hypothetical protein